MNKYKAQPPRDPDEPTGRGAGRPAGCIGPGAAVVEETNARGGMETAVTVLIGGAATADRKAGASGTNAG